MQRQQLNYLFDPRFEFKSFILEREGDNIVIYHSGHLKDVQPDIQQLGGAAKVLMNHDHESLGGPNQLDIPYIIRKMMPRHSCAQ